MYASSCGWSFALIGTATSLACHAPKSVSKNCGQFVIAIPTHVPGVQPRARSAAAIAAVRAPSRP